MYSILEDLESRTGVMKVKELANVFRVSEDAIYDLADQNAIDLVFIRPDHMALRRQTRCSRHRL